MKLFSIFFATVVLLLFSSTNASTGTSFGCILCNSFASAATDYLEQASSFTEVNDLLTLRCQKSTAAEACEAVRTAYLPRLFEYLKSDRSEQVVCLKLGYCGTDERAMERDEAPVKSITCFVCDQILDLAEAFVNYTEAEFTKKLLLSCQTLDLLDGVCRQIVEQYSSEIYVKTKQGVPPKLACFQMKLCDSNDTKSDLNTKEEVKDDCSLCREVVGRARALHKNGNSKSSLVSQLTEDCAKKGDSYASCGRFIAEQFDCLFPQLNNRMTAESVCSACLPNCE